jgi:glycosyltransferase involved in cell wall biosynthesis
MQKVLYLRTDFSNTALTAGGSVAHTLGVIKGFKALDWQVYCGAACMQELLIPLHLEQLVSLQNPTSLGWLRWKLNSFLSTFFFFREISKSIDVRACTIIYQRYSILNATGALLSWWYRKPLLLECNGSEIWVMDNWSGRKKWLQFRWLIKQIEIINLRAATLIIVVSEPLQEMLIQQYQVPLEKILVNPNGVDTDLFKPSH